MLKEKCKLGEPKKHPEDSKLTQPESLKKYLEVIHNIDKKEIERRKDLYRRSWNYRKVDHIPIGIWLDDFSEYSLKEQCENLDIQFTVNVKNISRCLKCIPDDYIPYARIWPGYMTIATMFGLEIHWGDDPNQVPGIKNPLIHDIEEIKNLKMPDPRSDGLMPFNLECLRFFSKSLPEHVYITGIDLGGPLNTAKDLFETNLLYTGFYDHPVEYHSFLNLVTQLQIDCYREIIKAAGGINRLTSIDFDPLWAPEGYKCLVSDDVCAAISPDTFRTFSKPYIEMIFRAFEGGRLHNCGPHPAVKYYLNNEIGLKGLNCSYRYTRSNLQALKEAFKGYGIVEFNFDNNETAEEIIKGFEEIANSLAPDVIGMPLVFLNETWKDDEITSLYHELRKISELYARELNFKND